MNSVRRIYLRISVTCIRSIPARAVDDLALRKSCAHLLRRGRTFGVSAGSVYSSRPSTRQQAAPESPQPAPECPGARHGATAMKLALLSDIHANLEALQACLAHARERGAERFAVLGDVVGYGADPGPVVDAVAGLVERGALAVRGNHDDAAVAGETSSMRQAAGAVIAWTRARLSAGQRAFLAGLPLVARDDGLFLVHASPELPSEWIYVTDPLRAARALDAAAPAPWVFCGHVHEPVLYTLGGAARPVPFRPASGVAIPVPPRRRWLAVVGSAGQPRDGNTAACYAMLDTDPARLTFHRVPYDWRVAAEKIRAAGLPEALARRLERGE
jgi:diadenosine tetraphosphatase ApaH/serine/threonine PP2A family protein phosphatase